MEPNQKCYVFPLTINALVSSAEDTHHLLADIVATDDQPQQAPAQDADSQGHNQNTVGTNVHGLNPCSSRVYCLRKDPLAKRFSNSWETNIKLSGRRQKKQKTHSNKDLFSSLPDNVLVTILT